MYYLAGCDTHRFSPSCAPANKVLDDEKDFRKSIEKRITTEEGRFLDQANAGSLKDLLSSCLDDAQGEQQKRQECSKVIQRAGKQTVIFANNFSSFLQAYSGIVEIMQGADQQYGGLAYSTLSLFLIVR